MFPRTPLKILASVVFALVASPAWAQFTRDNAANKKIDEAINLHYFATDFDKAEGVLLGTVNACENKCRAATLAKAWMYVGIVRGSGRNDQQGAAEAFQRALQLDPQIRLDAAISTPETVATFDSLVGRVGPAVPPPTTPMGPPPPTGVVAPPSGLACTPTPAETLTRAPIPISCLGAPDIAVMEIRFRPVHGEAWEVARMQRSGQYFQGQVPCNRTGDVGPMSVYVVAKDGAGTVIDAWGSDVAPMQYSIVNQTGAPPLALPGQAPPPRCSDVECPPNFPGCEAGPPGGAGNVAWGGVCISSSQCEAGLACFDLDNDGEKTCENPPPCTSDSDCQSGSCTSGKCEIDDSAEAEPGGPHGPGKKLWFGFHVAQDIVMVAAAEEICDNEKPQFQCMDAAGPYPSLDGVYFPAEGQRGAVQSGFAVATTRLLLSLDYAVTPNLMVGLRGGYALNGAPTYEGDPSPFLPVHVEGQAAYWFGRNPLGRTGLRPYLKLGAGMAQVDAHFLVNVLDCQRIDGEPGACGAPSELRVDAYQKLGRGFVAAGAGAVFAFGESAGFQVQVQGMYLLPDSGINIQPSLGFVLGL